MRLQPGDTVLLLAPAFAVAEEVARQAVRFWEGAGLQVRLMPHALGRHHAYSGRDEERRADLLAALQDPVAKAIHCLRGGYGLTRILDDLPLQDLLRQHPKYLIGFSDITAGLLAWEAAGFAELAVHGPMASHLGDAKAADALALRHWMLEGELDLRWADAGASRAPGFSAVAPVTGGNLTLLSHTLGSRYPLRAEDSFLLLEEVGEQLYHIDRMLVQLRRAGMLEGVAGVLLGHFTDITDIPQGFGATVEEIVRAHVPAGTVVAAGLPVGHDRPNYPIPFGVPMRLAASDKGWQLSQVMTA